jgi:hypothetical protein
MQNLDAPLAPPTINGTMVYTLIYAISKGIQNAKDQVVRPVRSAPPYEDTYLRFKVVREDIIREVDGRKIAFDFKVFEDSNLIIEAKTQLSLRDVSSLLHLKKILFEECEGMAKEFNPSQFFEEYIFFCIKDYDGTIDSYISGYKEYIAAMLKEETIKLASQEIDDTLDTNIRYGLQDIAIVDWDGAFLVDSTGEFKETIAVLELANIQLLNFRILDRRLTEKIDQLKRQIVPLEISSFLRLSPFMKDVIKIRSQSVLELEDIESALRLYGDWYTGKLYDLASKKFHLGTWRSQVKAKLEALEDLYEMIVNITTERYNLVLEFLIFVLIMLEIILALPGIQR